VGPTAGLDAVAKGNVNLSPCLIKHHAMEIRWQVETELYAVFTSELVEGVIEFACSS